MFSQDFQKTYTMVNPAERMNIIQQIDTSVIVSECATGQRKEWWTKKHHPENEIPKNIYLLGQGTVRQLYDQYHSRYHTIEWDEFIGFTRELIKQKIMV